MALTVNEVLTDLQRFDLKPVEVAGIFSYDLERVCLVHWPRSETLEHLDDPSIWLTPAAGPFAFDERALERFAGKRVVVEGDLYVAADPNFGFGHGSLWPAEIRVTDMRRVKEGEGS
ncbi:MAG: hypothetical protein RIC14_13835 [Filomicrobium sp.]